MRLVLFIISSAIDQNGLSRFLNEGRLDDLTPGALVTAPLTYCLLLCFPYNLELGFA
jgi:hypothetical protein